MSHTSPGCHADGPAPQTVAERYLETLQQRVYSALGLSPQDCQFQEWVGQQMVLPVRLQQKSLELPAAEFDAYRVALLAALARDEAAPRPTPYERPHQYSILRDLKLAIEEAADRMSFRLPTLPVIGTLPMHRLDPMMLPVPGSGEVVLVVDGSLLTFINLLSKAVAQTLPLQWSDDGEATVPLTPGWEHGIDATCSGGTRFVELIVATLNGNPSSAPAYLPESGYEDVAADLCDCMELFMVGREYARLIEGDHLAAEPALRAAHGQVFEMLTWSDEQELKADCIGLALMLAAAAARGTSLAWAFWSVDLLLSSFAILERAHWLSSNPAGNTLVGPVPNAFDYRRRMLREMATQWRDGAAAVEFAVDLQPIISHLDGRLEAHLLEMQFGQPTVH